jgi:uncharacterized membrane protein
MANQVFPRALPADRAIPSQVPVIRRIGTADLRVALTLGWEDFQAAPSQLFFLCIIYPVVALVFWKLTAGHGLLVLFYPLASGFALVGPIAAIGLYEISKERESGRPASWRNCFDVLHSPVLSSIILLSLVLMVIFLFWIAIAHILFKVLFDGMAIGPITDFLTILFTTTAGWSLVIGGNLVGLAFACVVLAISVVSFPMMVDRNVDAALAVRTSFRAVMQNRLVMARWGLIVGGLLALGSIFLFVGLAVVLPVLGHATWHLYRRLVAA